MPAVYDFAGKLDINEDVDYHQTGISSFKNCTLSQELVLCSVLVESPGVYFDGQVTACGCLDGKRELIIGDIKNDSLLGIRNGTKFLNIVKDFLGGDINNISLCSKCDVPYGPERQKIIYPVDIL